MSLPPERIDEIRAQAEAQAAAERERTAVPSEDCHDDAEATASDSGNTETSCDDGQKQKREKSQATRLVEMGRANYRLGVTDSDEPYGAHPAIPHIALMLRSGKTGLRAELARRYFESTRPLRHNKRSPMRVWSSKGMRAKRIRAGSICASPSMTAQCSSTRVMPPPTPRHPHLGRQVEHGGRCASVVPSHQAHE